MTSPATAAQYLLQLDAARANFLDFVRFQHPTWKLEPFQLELISILDALGKRQLLNSEGNPTYNVLINMPPRHGKSTIATWLWPAWLMIRAPAEETIMSCAYNSELAIDYGRRVRSYVQDKRAAQINPDFAIPHAVRAAEDWMTTSGGRYFGVGLNGTTTGRPATVLILDDPIKSRADAESSATRTKTWSFYTGSLSMRLQPTPAGLHPIQVVIHTRWHPDDPAGRIQASDDWDEGRWLHYTYRGITTDAAGVEHALWPSRFPLETLKRVQRRDPREFEAQYQQNPYVLGGEIIKESWWRTTPVDPPPTYASVVITLDTAYKVRTRNDFSVLLVAGLTPQGDIHILDVIRARLEYPDLRDLIVRQNAIWRSRGLRAIYIEDHASGQSLAQDLRREAGLSVIPKRVTHDKVTRATLQTPLIEGGRVFLPADAPWRQAFVLECSQFPSSTHDDQVDSLVLALDTLSRLSAPAASFDSASILNTSLNTQHAHYGKSLAELFGRHAFLGR